MRAHPGQIQMVPFFGNSEQSTISRMDWNWISKLNGRDSRGGYIWYDITAAAGTVDSRSKTLLLLLLMTSMR